jgi:hypothetical protein
MSHGGRGGRRAPAGKCARHGGRARGREESHGGRGGRGGRGARESVPGTGRGGRGGKDALR